MYAVLVRYEDLIISRRFEYRHTYLQQIDSIRQEIMLLPEETRPDLERVKVHIYQLDLKTEGLLIIRIDGNYEVTLYPFQDT